MTPRQVTMARTALKWSMADLGNAARIGVRNVADLEAGRPVSPWVAAAVRVALEAQHIRFIASGALAGGIIRSRLRFIDRGWAAHMRAVRTPANDAGPRPS